ncbi:MAG: MarR family transcriptional regulator [Gammaproteobacteria bacterium]|nr:MarR family transcriptional regulator [Gammaproteobacteria bacterium]
MSTLTPDSEQLKCMNLQMLRASHVVLKTYDDAYRPFGIRATQLPVLNLIAQQGKCTIRDIADETESERSVLSRKLQVMEKNGWIGRESIAGTREQAYILTDTGRQLLDKVKPVRLEVQQQLLGRLDENERHLLIGLCDKLKA